MTAPPAFQPLVPATEQPRELTFSALVLGAFIGIVFGAASAYLALRVGLTVSASVPAAVIAIAVLRRRGHERRVLEHNITQTVGSAGESIASAVIFTVPALIFLGYPLHVGLTTLIALTGGVLGVLMMVPLRRYLIVKEHGRLRYPEGRACAEILTAGEKGGTSARKVFLGMAIGVLAKGFQAVLAGVKSTVSFAIPGFKGGMVGCDVEPPLLGVGYIIGYKVSLLMVAGSMLSSWVLIPLIRFFGQSLTTPLAPGVDLISAMSPDDIWNNYVRYIGAGAVAAGGIFGLVRALPAIVSSVRASAGALVGGTTGAASRLRTDRDMPTTVLLCGALGLVTFIWLTPAFQMNLLGAVIILVLGFLFAVVSSRITGEVGSSSCPLSGMTIAVLMGTCGAFIASGWEGPSYSRLALMIGAVVCVAISNAGTCSQDLKTGFLLGSTPVRQQWALLIGIVTSVLVIGWTTYFLNLSKTREQALTTPFVVGDTMLARAELVDGLTDHQPYRFVRLDATELPQGLAPGNYLVDPSSHEARYQRIDGIGSEGFPAPQARLMSVVIDGLLTHRLPWDLILLGVAIAVFVEILGFGSLTFAVGVYLPLSSTMPVFLGGLARRFADRRFGRVPDAEDEPEGVLFSSGLIAGASIVGILSAGLAFMRGYDFDGGYHPAFAVLRHLPFSGSDVWAVIVIAAVTALVYWGARPQLVKASQR